MRYSTAVIVAAMGIGEALAGPAHAHLHRKAHEKKDVDWDSLDWNAMGIDWASAYSAGMAAKTQGGAAAPAPVATTAAAAAPTPVADAVGAVVNGAADIVGDITNTISNDVSQLFDALVGASNSRTTFGASSVNGNSKSVAGDFYMGEYGAPYGSNIIKVGSTAGYDFTATFHNTQSSPITVNIWNKVGPDFQPLSGSALAPRNTSLTFVLPAGSSQVVAFMENSQVAWAQACSKTAASGAYATSWGEANFLSAGSGYDMSAIMNAAGNKYNMAISSVEAPACTSDTTQNFWLTPTEPIGTSDGSCFIAQNTATLKVVMGGVM